MAPLPIRSLLDKYIFHKHEEIPPPLTTRAAVALLTLYTIVYVVPLYASPITRPSARLSRDAPSVIRARIASVTFSSVLCSLGTLAFLTTAGIPGASRLPAADALHLMGYWPVGLQETLQVLGLTAALFAGPLFETLVVEGGWRDWVPGGGDTHHHALASLYTWTTWRNLVAGPVTEEVLFRAAAVPLLVLARTPVSTTVFLSPVVFGLAHVHHGYEFHLTHPAVPWLFVALRSLVQFAFTTLFGAYATFLFLRTGSLLAVCVVHSFCNSLGLPRFWGMVHPEGYDDDDEAAEVPAKEKLDGDAVKKTASPSSTPRSASKHGRLLWTVVYYIILVAGAVYWYQHLWTLTESPLALASFSPKTAVPVEDH